METRAHFVLIGAFSLSILLSAFLFVLWFAGSEIDRSFDQYDVVFDSAVTGLSEGGDVRYSGIKIGEVSRLSLNKDRPDQVTARIRVTEDAPIYADSKAQLEVQGLTGVAFILITNSENTDRQMLKEVSDLDVPVLKGDPSALQELVSTAPGLIEGATTVLTQLQLLLGDENREKITTILTDFEDLSSSLVDRSDQIGTIVDNFSTISSELAGSSSEISNAAAQLAEFSSTANAMLGGEGALLLQDSRAAVQSVRTLSDNTNALLENNAGAIQTFSDDGLAQLGPFLTDTRATMETLNRILQRMESDPARYLSGNYASEYEPQ